MYFFHSKMKFWLMNKKYILIYKITIFQINLINFVIFSKYINIFQIVEYLNYIQMHIINKIFKNIISNLKIFRLIHHCPV